MSSPAPADCHGTKVGCLSDAPASVWEELARKTGFPVQPEGDFFAFARVGCIVDTDKYPKDLRALTAASSLVVVGKINDVVVAAKPYVTSDQAEYMVRYSVAVEGSVKGDVPDQLLINEICATGGKVAGLRNTIPDQRFLFFLDGPWRLDPDAKADPEEQLAYGLAWYYLGVVRETVYGNVEFAHDREASVGLLDGFPSIDQLAQAASETGN